MNARAGKGFLLIGVLLIAACSEPPDATVAEVSSACDEESGVAFLCGVENGEDILRLGDSEWLLVSGMNGALSGTDTPGRLYLVDHETRAFEVLFPGDDPVIEQDRQMYSGCPGPIQTDNISVHGLALQPISAGRYRLYVTSHGAREAIEAFELDATGKPAIRWVGCVPMPNDSFTNSVTILADGGFYATKFMDPVAGIAPVQAGEITGYVFEWHPGEDVTVIPGTELSGANGIETSDDERWLYVAAFGSQEVVRFDTRVSPVAKQTVQIDVSPDNLRWTPDGTLYTAGAYTNSEGWGVVEIDPESMTASNVTGVDAAVTGLEDASVAFPVGDEIWVGSFIGERLAILPRP